MVCQEELCGFLDVCPAFTDYQNKTNPILNPDFHEYCLDSRNETGYCPLYDYHEFKELQKSGIELVTNLERLTDLVEIFEKKL